MDDKRVSEMTDGEVRALATTAPAADGSYTPPDPCICLQVGMSCVGCGADQYCVMDVPDDGN